VRRAFFFPTFTMKNIPFWARELRRNPGLAANQLKPFRARNDEREALVEWQADQLRIRLDKDGRSVHVLTGIDMPITNLDTLWGGGAWATMRKAASLMAPIPRTVLEQIGGTNLMTGRPLHRAETQTIGRALDSTFTPTILKDWLQYKKVIDDAGRPTYTVNERAYALLIRSWMFSRVFSTQDRVYRDMLTNADKSTLQALLESYVLGIRYNEINLDDATKRKLDSRIRQLREAINLRGASSAREGQPKGASLR
jgi:hypothetical protein